MNRFNYLVKATGYLLLLVTIGIFTTSCDDNSGSTYPGSSKWKNGNGNNIYGEWIISETGDDGMELVLVRYAKNNTGRLEWLSSEILKEGKYHDLKMLKDPAFKIQMMRSVFIKQDEFIGLELGNEHDFNVQREAGTITFHGKVTGTRGYGDFEFTPNQAFMEYAQEKGYSSSSVNKGLNLFISNINKTYFDDLIALGYDHWPMERINEFVTHGVSISFIRDIHTLGYKDISPSKLVEFRKHGVSPEFVKEIQQAGYMDISPDNLVAFRKHGVTPEFIREIQQAGLRDISPDKLVKFRIHGVSSQFIKEVQQAGYRDGSPDKLIELRIHGGNDPNDVFKVPGKEGIPQSIVVNAGNLQRNDQGLQLGTSRREISMLPGGWILSMSRIIHTDDYIELYFKSTEYKAEASFTVVPYSGTLRDLQGKIPDTINQSFKSFTIRPGSRVHGEIDGLPSSAYIADYDNEGKKMTEYGTYILNEQYLGLFKLHAEKKSFDEIKTGFDSMVQSLKWKNK